MALGRTPPGPYPLATALLLCLLLPATGRTELRIPDLDSELARNIRAFVTLDDVPCDAELWRIRRRFRTLESEAREALRPFGYYSPEIRSSLEPGESCWQATLNVKPGDPVRIRDVDIRIEGEAASDPSFGQVSRQGLETGAQLRHANYERFKQDLQLLAADRGYVEAAFSSARLDVWPAEDAADVTLRFASGPRYDFGEVRLEQDIVDPDLVSRFLDIEEGTPFDGRELIRARTALLDSGYFGRINIVPLYEQADNGRIPVRVVLSPGTRIEYTIGVGASTDTGPRFRAGFRNNRLNEKGHKLITDLNVSTALQGLSAQYRKPLADPRSDRMTYTAALKRETNDTFTSDSVRAGLRRTKRINSFWIRTQSLDATFEDYEVGEESSSSRLLLPALAFDHLSSELDMYPDRGLRLGVEALGTSTAIGSDTTFFQLKAHARWVRSLGAKSRLITRARAGTTWKSDFDELPPSVRFFAGGDVSVRGFDYDSLGPQDAEGNVIGGSHLLVASAEVERQLFGNYYGAVFVDAGNAFDDFDVEPAVGAGVGIKWRSPLGPLRLYVGFPVTDQASGPRLHINLGPDL